MNSKAEKRNMVIVGFVLLIVIVIIMVLFMKSIGTTTDILAEKNKCKQSVYAAGIHIKDISFTEEINCPTKYTTIADKEPKKINKKLADSMINCWDNFGQGKLQLFNKENVFCSVCEIIDFKEKDQKIYGLTEYLFKTDIPSTNKKYADFLMGHATQESKKYVEDPNIYEKLKNQFETSYIDTSNKYAVVFVYAFGKSAIDNLKDAMGGRTKSSLIFGSAAAVGGGVAAGLIICSAASFGVCAAAVGITAAVIGGVTAAITYFSGDNPEWVSFIQLVDYDEHSLGALGCQYLPVEQKTT